MGPRNDLFPIMMLSSWIRGPGTLVPSKEEARELCVLTGRGGESLTLLLSQNDYEIKLKANYVCKRTALRWFRTDLRASTTVRLDISTVLIEPWAKLRSLQKVHHLLLRIFVSFSYLFSICSVINNINIHITSLHREDHQRHCSWEERAKLNMNLVQKMCRNDRRHLEGGVT